MSTNTNETGITEEMTQALGEAGITEEVIQKLEETIIKSGNGEILNMVKENQELFEIANSLLFRAVGLAANADQDVFIINANNGVVFVTEEDYTKTLEASEIGIKEQICAHYPDLEAKGLSEKYDEYVAQITLKHIDKEVAKNYISAIQAQQAQQADAQASAQASAQAYTQASAE